MEPVPVDEGDTVPGASRLRASYALDEDGAWIAQARHLAAAFLTRARAEDGLPVSARAVEITQLVVSELVTNARKYAPGPVLMELRITTGSVEIVVWDSDPTVPAARASDPDRIGQHGLEIVKAVTEDLFVEQAPVGKRITARIALPTHPAAATAPPAAGHDSLPLPGVLVRRADMAHDHRSATVAAPSAIWNRSSPGSHRTWCRGPNKPPHGMAYILVEDLRSTDPWGNRTMSAGGCRG